MTKEQCYEKWLQLRLSKLCGDSALDLEDTSKDLDYKIKSAKSLKMECLDQFYVAFREEGQTFEAYLDIWNTAYDEAFAAGELPVIDQ